MTHFGFVPISSTSTAPPRGIIGDIGDILVGGGDFGGGGFVSDPCDLLQNAVAIAICKGIIPGGGDPDPIGPCEPGFINVDGRCVPSGTREHVRLPDIDPSFTSPAELPPSMHANGHADHIPGVTQRRTRVCRRGSVLGKDGWCHPKGTIRNADREYPKGRRPLGTPADLKAVTVAARFGRRLVANKKRIKKLERDLARVS